MSTKKACVLAIIAVMGILLVPFAAWGQEDDQAGLSIKAYGPDSIREDVRVVIGAIVTEMRGLELPEEAGEILVFDAETRQGLREESFEYGGFRCIGVIPRTFRNSTDDPQTKILEGTAIFRDQVGRRTLVEFRTSYQLAQEKIIIREAYCNSLYPYRPEVMLFFVPADAVSANLLETQDTHAKLLKFISENALTMEQLAATSGNIQKYFVFACAMDRIPDDAKLELLVSQSKDGSIGPAQGSMDVNYDGWHVAILRGQFKLKTEPEYFFKVIYTPGKDAPLEERKARVVSLFSSMLQASPPTPVPTPAGHKLVAYYPFNGDTQDHSGNGNHGTNHGATFVSGVSGKALEFNGKDDWVEVDSSKSLDTKNKITLEAWINPKNDGAVHPILEYNDGTNFGVHVWQWKSWPDLFVNFFDTTGRYLTAYGVMTTDWQHIAVVYDGTYGKLYRNGELVASKDFGALTLETSYDFYIGRRPSHGDGTIEKVSDFLIFHPSYPTFSSCSQIVNHHKVIPH